MNVVNKNIKIAIVIMLILITVSSGYLMYRNWNNNKKTITLDDVKLKDKPNKKGLAIILEQEDGTYKESSDGEFPDNMIYNEEKSGCLDDKGNNIPNALSYDSNTKEFSLRTNSKSNCYLYFDLISDDIKVTVSTDGSSGVMPSSGIYTYSATCNKGEISWNQKYQRIEIGSLSRITYKCNLDFTKDTKTYTLLKTEVEQKATTNANGYRYSGKTPDNYIWFNNELWRIIGSIPTCTSSGCGTSENLVKIIRDESIGGLAYDAKSSGYTGAWGSNTLYTLLNTYYYGAKDGTGTSYCYGYQATAAADCDYTEKGIDSTSYYGKMIKNVYWNTGLSDSSITIATAYANEIATQTISGYVGLMSASDYGYAADSSYHSTSLGSYGSSVAGSNWLYTYGNGWTMVQNTTTTYALNVGSGGYMTYGGTYIGYVIRPVVFLNSSVFIIEGSGKQSDPYILGM